MRVTRAIIHLDYLRENVRGIRSFVTPGAMMCVPVKADAYGHGAVECARAALEAGADYLAVATVDEGAELRRAGIQAPILLLSLCAPEEMGGVVQNGLIPVAFDEEYIGQLAREVRDAQVRYRPGSALPEAAERMLAAPEGYPVHLAIDTGMGRIGCLPEDAPAMAARITEHDGLSLGGVMTHFAVSDSTAKAHRLFTQVQFSRFTEAVEAVRRAGICPGICHCANSAAVLDLPETHLDMVRPGIIVYGYYADEISADYLAAKGTPLVLRPVMTLETRVSAIRRFRRGMSAGYGRTWTAPVETDVAVLPVGYGDGFVRRFAQAGVMVTINGRNYPLVGRICMDQCMVDVGRDNPDIRRWDRAVLFGSPADGAAQTADDLARMTGTISYEITTVLTRRVERVFIGTAGSA